MNVNLDKIIEILEMTNDSSTAFYHPNNEEIVWLSEYMERDEYEKTEEISLQVKIPIYLCLKE